MLSCGVSHPYFQNAFNNAEYFPDFTIDFPCTNKVIRVHKILLSQTCYYFSSDKLEANTCTITLPTQEQEIFISLLECTYTCQLSMCEDLSTIQATVDVAIKYDFHEPILTPIIDYLIQHITPENALSCFQWCSSRTQDQITRVQSACIKSIDLFTNEILTLTYPDFSRLLKRITEESNHNSILICQVYDAMYKWISYERFNREKYSFVLLKLLQEGIEESVVQDAMYESIVEEIDSDEECSSGPTTWSLSDSINLNHFRQQMVITPDERIVEHENEKRVTFSMDKPKILGE